MLLLGIDVENDHQCQIIAPPHTMQVVFRVATIEEHPTRKPIGFIVERNEPDDEEA
jgi:hypothetical protein